MLRGRPELVGGADPAAPLRSPEEQFHPRGPPRRQAEGSPQDREHRQRSVRWQHGPSRGGGGDGGGAVAGAQRRHAAGLELRGSARTHGRGGEGFR